MTNLGAMKLGKLPPKHDRRTLYLSTYIETVPPAPAAVDYTGAISDWPMYLNNSLGDCTIAGAAHMIEVWTQQIEGTAQKVTDQDVLIGYEAVAGYDPSTGANDNGAVEIDVLNYWRTTGVGGYKLKAWTSVSTVQKNWTKAGLWLFGGLYLGVALPISAQQQNVWDWDPKGGTEYNPGSWGGHCVPAVAYDDNGVVFVTWGGLKRMTWAFWDHYVDEAYCAIPEEYYKLNSLPLQHGFNVAQLEADLQKIVH